MCFPLQWSCCSSLFPCVLLLLKTKHNIKTIVICLIHNLPLTWNCILLLEEVLGSGRIARLQGREAGWLPQKFWRNLACIGNCKGEYQSLPWGEKSDKNMLRKRKQHNQQRNRRECLCYFTLPCRTLIFYSFLFWEMIEDSISTK